MHTNNTTLAGHASEAQDRSAPAGGQHGARHVQEWVLTLVLAGPDRLLAVLSDGHSGCQVAEPLAPDDLYGLARMHPRGT